ncbi:28s ribosomal protein s34 mitochondrial [Holotrichia oblita]|uniref:28s ribosomal protein s34 mitochondrial n=1 Tax=Holotrichia oblita TaxID=644536 RepID=A0ACB9TU54_HOLOL|nr:28s ribosomal protein s34 mitochondrial [Holotrichia oblita]
MPYKYIGRTHSFKGKTLWEIVGNLKNFGVGRLVNLRKVKVLLEKTFRGVTNPKPVCIESASYKTDYCLIPKDEEQRYCQYKAPVTNEKIFPSEPVVEPVMDIVYNDKKRRIAKEGEKPTIEIKIGLGKPAALSLYKGIKLE